MGDLLRRARRTAGLTQEDLAERAGLSARGISDLERGIIRAPRRDTLELLADALDLAPEERRHWLRRRRAIAAQTSVLPASSRMETRALVVLPPVPETVVGREHEQGQLRRLLDEGFAGRGRLVLLGGEAGIGKTTLAGLLCRAALERGALVLTGHCYDLAVTPPYGPWLEITDQYPATPELPALPDVLRRGTGVGDLASQQALFAVARSFFAAVSARRPLVLVLEDLHWADPASLELLRDVARHVAALPLLLVVTYRIDELTRRHPLYQLLPLLVREAQPERIDLRPLDASDVQRLVAERYALAPGDQRRLAAYLGTLAEGNPFFVDELLRTLETERVLHVADDGWALGALDRTPVPALVRQVIEARLARWDDQARRLLEIAAVIGRRVPFDLWQSISAAGEERTLDVVERALEAHLLQVDRDDTRLQFAHALTHEALYEGIVPPRRRLWHRQAGEALAETPQPDPDAVAWHFQQAGDARAVDWLIQAGERAQRSYAWPMAIERFNAAVQLMEGDATRARERGWLLFRLGRLVRWSDPAAGVSYMEEAQQAATTSEDALLGAQTLFNLGLLRCYAGDPRRGIPELTAGVEAIDALPADLPVGNASSAAWIVDALPGLAGKANEPHRVRANHGTLAIWLATVGRYAEAIDMAEACVAWRSGISARDELANELRERAGAYQSADAYHTLGIAYAEVGRPDDARTALMRAAEMYDAIGQHGMVVFCVTNYLSLLTWPYRTTQLAERERLAVEVTAAWSRGQAAISAGLSPRFGEAVSLFLTGQWVEVRRLIDTIDPGLARLGRERLTSVLGPILCNQGEYDSAWALVREVVPDGPATEPGGSAFDTASQFQRLAAELSLDEGDLEDARAWLDAHDRWLHWSGAVRGRAEGQLLWARYHLAAGDPAAARARAEESLAHAGEPRQPLALLAAQRVLGQLDTGAGRHADAERRLSESLALADACAAPFERALTLLALAELRASTGQDDAARSLLAEVRCICEPLGAAPTLARVEALAAQLPSLPADPGRAATE
jgi:transcriptional regulator with XRE-family HTH domain/tetratricopeptide (TPR) repeat protein